MKSKDLQKLVFSKYEARQTSKKILQDLNGAVSYQTVEQWCKMILETNIETTHLSQNSSHQGSHTKDQKKIKE